MTDILGLIPQRPPIVMVDRFFGLEAGVSRTGLLVREDNLFVDGGVLDECGLIEHIAQSAAARAGYAGMREGRPVSLGFIGSVNDFRLLSLPEVGDCILTEITVIQEVFRITLIEARCRVDGKEIASCRMKIFLDRQECGN